MHKFLLLNVLTLSLFACERPVKIQGFDSRVWKSDPMGCQGNRKQFAEILDKNKDLLKSKSPNQIIALLGSPDKQELYERNQRYYLYFYDKGKQCEAKTALTFSNTPLIRIRFSAIDIVTEVVIQ